MIQCSYCGKVLTSQEVTYGHECPRAIFTSGSTERYEIEMKENKHSVIVNGVEYLVNADKLAILEQLIKLK